VNTQLLWFLGLVIIALTQALVLVLRLSQGRANRKNEPPASEDSENPSHGERIASLETKVEGLEENNEKDHELIRKDIRKIFNLINGMRK